MPSPSPSPSPSSFLIDAELRDLAMSSAKHDPIQRRELLIRSFLLQAQRGDGDGDGRGDGHGYGFSAFRYGLCAMAHIVPCIDAMPQWCERVLSCGDGRGIGAAMAEMEVSFNTLYSCSLWQRIRSQWTRRVVGDGDGDGDGVDVTELSALALLLASFMFTQRFCSVKTKFDNVQQKEQDRWERSQVHITITITIITIAIAIPPLNAGRVCISYLRTMQ